MARWVERGFVPAISKGPGFAAYYVIDAGNDWAASVSVFENLAEAEASNRMAAEWAKDNIASFISGAPEITTGAVAVYKAA